MSKKTVLRWIYRLSALVLAVYMAVAAYPSHRDFLKLIGGVLICYFFVWIGGEIERNRVPAPQTPESQP